MIAYKKLYEKVYEINLLEASDEELKKISEERQLSLSLEEMRKIKAYFKEKGRNPTDVELEAIAQAWSEHCCYKSSKPFLRETIFKIKAPQNICVISEDAGVVEFNESYAYVVALESHNHPSALDPYGGAATGIGGILRDVVCMGAKPIALIDPLFFGPLDYSYEKLPPGTKHPLYLLKGVIAGIADYGNRVGIPTVAGMIEFDDSYITNCLVNVGCIGIVKKDKIVHSRIGSKDDLLILAGGLTGRDGIHGVTFASAELDEKSEETSIPAVQLGNPIAKEPLIHACLEAVEKGLVNGMKDLGGGGLSCVSAEMAHAAGLGAKINLNRVPLKEPDLAPWEIWVSESQERMMLSVSKENVSKVLEIFEFWDVPATVVGEAIKEEKVIALYKGKKVLELDLDFLFQAIECKRSYKIKKRVEKDKNFEMPNLVEICKKLISSPRICSKAFVIRRYDYEVKGKTILKPLQGLINEETHGDAAVIKPLDDSFRGLAITADVNPRFCKLHPYHGSASAVDEVFRNLIAVNSKPHSLADCLNFGNPEKPYRLGEFVESVKALYETAKEFSLPFVSGNVSFYNESPFASVAPTPTLLGVGIVEDIRKVISADLKKEGNFIYLVGETKREMGGSEYYRILGFDNYGKVPRVDAKKTRMLGEKILKAMDLGLVKACHDISTGGLFIALAEMCFGSNLGVKVDISSIDPKLRTDFKLFSESNGRWLVEVKANCSEEFESIVNATKLGIVTKEKNILVKDNSMEISLDLIELKELWRKGIEYEL